ncbi:MAG: ABC transporter permease [Chloroflexota bacterium]|nr:MAG: ABC transporter permease [Chloroflexota bacterium]
MVTTFLKITTVFRLAFKRLISQRWLALATAMGLTVSVALVMSIPLYADATHFRLLNERVSGQSEPGEKTPLSFLFRFKSPRNGGPQWADLQSADEYMSSQAGNDLGLPTIKMVRLFETDTFKLFPPFDAQRPETKYFLGWVHFSLMDEMADSTHLVTGQLPSTEGETLDGSVEVLVNEEFALEFGVQIGDTYYARRDNGLELPVRVTGIWAPLDPRESFWDSEYQNMLFTSEKGYAGPVSEAIEDEAIKTIWFISVDGSALHSGDVAGLLERIKSMRQRLEMLLPTTKLIESPLKELEQYQVDAPTLTLLLYAFSVPILGLILAFIGLVAGLFVSQHQNEIAVLRSRGASATQVVGIAAVEGVLIGAVALGLGIPLGELVAHAIGRARSFLNFSEPTSLRVSLTTATLWFGLAAIGTVLLLQIVIPTIGAARRTIVTFKQERARSTRPPWWQRAWLDMILMIPAAYGVYMLQQQGSIAQAEGTVTTDPFHNPLLLLVPALGIFALTLFTLRLIPIFMSAIAWFGSRTNSVGLVIAARYLSRTPAFYSTPLALLVLTLSLSAFTASMAQTLDRHLYRQLYYQNGADISLLELGITSNEGNPISTTPGQNQGDNSGVATPPSWIFNPVEDHLRIDGVQGATRVGSYAASLMTLEGQPVSGRFIGVDRMSFPEVAFWQRNFANDQLGILMNLLAQSPFNVLVAQSYMEEEALKPGDTINVFVNIGSDAIPLKSRIVGSFNLFPTWYPEEGPLVVGNLDDLYFSAGGDYPHEVWLKTGRSADLEKIAASVRGYTDLLTPFADPNNIVKNGLNIFVDEWQATPLQIAETQRLPERQGLFGLLSVGFATSALLTVLGFLLYAVFSFRRRFIELGMLRAVGLSSGQLTALLAWELAFLIMIGIGVGTVLGVWVSKIFIPYLQVGVETAAHYPPFVVEIAWPSIFQIYLLFGMLFIAALVVLVVRLLHMKIFQAIKLGETA